MKSRFGTRHTQSEAQHGSGFAVIAEKVASLRRRGTAEKVNWSHRVWIGFRHTQKEGGWCETRFRIKLAKGPSYLLLEFSRTMRLEGGGEHKSW